LILRKAIKNNLSDGIANSENHCMDNTFISCDIENTSLNMKFKHYEPIGICAPPYVSANKYDVALVFETEDFEKKWCHLSAAVMRNWEREKN
jgi:hypothetical protein